MDCLLAGCGIDIKQPIDHLLGKYGLRNDLFWIARLHLEITYLLRITHCYRASLTETGAACFPDVHFSFQPLLLNLLFKGVNYFCCAKSEATCSSAYRNARLIRTSL